MIFLDIDGVLATAHTYNVWRKAAWAASHPDQSYPQGRAAKAFKKDALDNVPADANLLDANCCARVQKLCDLTGAVIIVSSSWRQDIPLDALTEMFYSRGLTADVVGATPTKGHRGQEIDAVVQRMGLPQDNFVILEDKENVAPYNGRCVRTAFMGTRPGFGERHLHRALRMLGKSS